MLLMPMSIQFNNEIRFFLFKLMAGEFRNPEWKLIIKLYIICKEFLYNKCRKVHYSVSGAPFLLD